MGGDSVSIEEEAGAAPRATYTKSDWVNLLILFAVFLVVSSDLFVYNVVGAVPKCVDGRDVTSRGELVRGLFLVLGYMAVTYAYGTSR